MKLKVLALAATLGLTTMAAQASELPDGPHIVTSGTASVAAVPDIATLAIEVNVSAKDAASAKKQADDRVAQYLSFLEKSGIAKKDINSANLRTQPDYDYQNGKSILKGYRAVRTVEVTLRQLDKLNGLLDGALKAGLNEIRSVSLGVAQPDAYKDKARKAAIDDAVHQAQELAAGFHSKLGPVYSVRYHVSNYQPSPMVRMMKAADAAPVSAQETYEQATIQFDDQVDVVFELQPAQAAAPATPAKPAETPKTGPVSDRNKKATSAKWLFYARGLILTQHLVSVVNERIGHPAHHAAFRGEAVPVEHAALEQARGEIDKFAAVELFFDLQMRDHTAGGALARQLHESFRRVDDVAGDAARRQVEVLLQERLMHIVQMVEGDDWRLKQRRTRHAIREIALRKLF